MKQITIIGNLGKDAEVKRIGDNDYAVFTVGVKDDENTQWFNCYKYGTNEKLLPYLTKGSKMLIQGKLSIKTSEKEGKTYVNANINVANIEFLSSKSESSTQTAPTQAPAAQPFAAAPVEDDSDLPF